MEKPSEKISKKTSPLNRDYPLKAAETISTLSELLDRGITRISVLVRHSARHYHRDPGMEPFMGLTPEGQSFAYDMGCALPRTLAPSLFASHIGRCIETAYLIDKGYTRTHGAQLDHPATSEVLAPFYIKDMQKALELVNAWGSQTFIRNWFDRTIDQGIMEDPEKTAQILIRFMRERLTAQKEHTVSICVSHDWNIFPIKEFKLGLPHEGAGDVGYLDGVVFFEEAGSHFATTYQITPVAL